MALVRLSQYTLLVRLSLGFVDKLLLLRFFRRPPHVGSGTLRVARGLVPFALIGRLLFACASFADPGVLQSGHIQLGSQANSYAESAGELI
jgi:hypothetical protein